MNKEQYMDPKCGCMTFAYYDGPRLRYTERAFCERHRLDNEIALVERRIRDLRERYKAQTQEYQRERAGYLERLKTLKNE